MIIACQSPDEMLECYYPLSGLWSRGYTVSRDWAGLGDLIEQRISGGGEVVAAPLPKPQTFTTWRFSR